MADSLTISIGADSAKLRADLEIARQELARFATELRAAAKASLATGDRSAVDELARQYDRARAHVLALQGQIRKLGDEHRGFGDRMRETWGEFGRRVGEVRSAIGEMTDRVMPRISEVAALSVAGAVAEFAKLTVEANRAVRETQNFSESIRLGTDDFEAFGQIAREAGVPADAFSRGLSHAAQVIGKAREELAKARHEMPEFGAGANVLRGNVEAASGAVGVLRGQIAGVAGAGKAFSESVGDGVSVLRGMTQGTIDLSDPLKTLRIDVGQFADNFKGQRDLYIEIARRLTAMGESAQKAAVAQQYFGRGWREIVPALAGISTRAEEVRRRIEESGLGLSDFDKQQSAAFNRSLEVTRGYLDRTTEIIGVGLGQGLTPVFDEIQKQLTQNIGAIRTWSVETGKYLADVARDFIDVFKGDRGGQGQLALRTDFAANFTQAREAIIAATGAVREFFNVARQIGNGINAALAPVNQLLGSHFTASGLVVTGVLLKMSGAFSAIRAAASVTALLFTPAGPFLVGLGLVAAAGLVIYKNWQGLENLWRSIKFAASELADYLGAGFKAAWASLRDFVGKVWNGIVGDINSAVDKVLSLLQGLFDKARAVARTVANVFGGNSDAATAGLTSGGAGFAGGGYVRGPGTGTSDSIVARLSAGEFVVNAAAAARVGTGFLDALNGFARGGIVSVNHLVESAMPRFAAGGLVAAGGGGGVLNLTIGDRTFAGLSAPQRVFDQLSDFARRDQLTSTGRKPSSYNR